MKDVLRVSVPDMDQGPALIVIAREDWGKTLHTEMKGPGTYMSVPAEKAPDWWVWPTRVLKGEDEIKRYRDACRRVEQRGTPALRI